jgi:DNA anti-recombination protein RmuC
MTAASVNALRRGDPSQRVLDEKMEQIRDLLLGDDLRRIGERLNAVEDRLRTLETDVSRRMDAIQARIEALGGEMSGEQRAAFDALSQGVAELAQRVKNISRI